MSNITRIVSAVRQISNTPYEIILVTWAELYKLHLAGKLKLNACYQRSDASPIQWKSKFAGGILREGMPTVIALRRLMNGTYEVMDGLQRMLTLIAFKENKVRIPLLDDNGQPFVVTHGGVTFSVGGKTLREIESTLDGKEFIKSVLGGNVLTVQYKGLSDDQASDIFVKLNDNTDLNPAEKINGFQGAVNDLARLLARGMDKEGNIDPSKRLKLLGVIQLKVGRLVYDDFIYRCMLMEMWRLNPNAKEGIFYDCADVVRTREMVTGLLRTPANAHLLLKIEKEIRRRCDRVILSWIKDSGTLKKPLHTKSLWDLLTLYQLTHVMEHRFGRNYKCDTTFSTNLFVGMTYLKNKKEAQHIKTRRWDGEKTMLESLSSSTRPDLVAKKLQLILDRVGDKGVTVVDSKRVFEHSEIYCQWVAQNKLCGVTGLPLAFEDAVGGHRDAHADGNPSDAYTNLVVIHKTINAKMGSKSYDEYMAIHYPAAAAGEKVAHYVSSKRDALIHQSMVANQ